MVNSPTSFRPFLCRVFNFSASFLVLHLPSQAFSAFVPFGVLCCFGQHRTHFWGACCVRAVILDNVSVSQRRLPLFFYISGSMFWGRDGECEKYGFIFISVVTAGGKGRQGGARTFSFHCAGQNGRKAGWDLNCSKYSSWTVTQAHVFKCPLYRGDLGSPCLVRTFAPSPCTAPTHALLAVPHTPQPAEPALSLSLKSPVGYLSFCTEVTALLPALAPKACSSDMLQRPYLWPLSESQLPPSRFGVFSLVLSLTDC